MRQTIKYFFNNGLKVSCAIIEKQKRLKYSATENQFNSVHSKYNEIIKQRYLEDNKLEKALLTYSPIYRKLTSWNDKIRKTFTEGSLFRWRKDADIKSFEVEKHSSQETKMILDRYDIKYTLLLSSRWLIREPLLSMKTKIINIHPGKLPEHRSLDSIPWSLMSGDKIGVTSHIIDAGIDTGPILQFQEIRLQPGDNLHAVGKRALMMKPMMFYKAVAGLESEEIAPKPQDIDKGTHHKPMTIEQLLEAEKALERLCQKK